MTNPSDWTMVKIPREAHDQAKELLARVSKEGWKSVGLDLDVPPTLGMLFVAGLGLLAKRGGKK